MAAAIRDRAAAAIIGAVVADAAALPTHWIYSREELESALSSSPAFGPNRATRWHPRKAEGDLTMYGEGALVLASSLADPAQSGRWSQADFRRRYLEAFGPGGTYSGYVDKTTRQSVYKALTLSVENEGRLYPSGPVKREAFMGMFPHWAAVVASEEGSKGEGEAAEAALRKIAEIAPAAAGDAPTEAWARGAAAAHWRIAHSPIGAKDDQSNALCKVAVAAAAFAGKADFAQILESVVRSTQDDDAAVSWFVPAARIVEAAVLGRSVSAASGAGAGEGGEGGRPVTSPEEAVQAALPFFTEAGQKTIREAIEAASSSAAAAVQPWEAGERFGNACGSSSTVPLAVYALLLRSKGSQGQGQPQTRAYAEAVQDALRSGGESAARAGLVGAVMGALGGRAGLPDAWVDRVNPAQRAALLDLAPRIAAFAHGAGDA